MFGRGNYSKMMSAESIINKRKWADNDCIEKKRIHKRYRIPELNKTLVYQRTTKEAMLLCKAKILGINVPTVYFVTEDTIYMEAIPGPTLFELQQAQEKEFIKSQSLKIGKCVALLHNNNIVHGDLSPMNIIVNEGTPYLIDFGLSFNSHTVEDYAVDMAAFEKVLNDETAFNLILDGYNQMSKQSISVRLDIVRQRGRKK